ncbi:AAA family ATPase [Mobilicoccus massiliensis]|uniref:AAA family ATPase n=1 Tax=Mobilicoccus massiliensis TaxID=1522310 RepID=UPI0009E5429D|nr:AAA family ATPase [Mobilicoccus massiliensis]
MRIHRLVLSHVKGVTEREVVFPDEGIVVVEGANEAGKTTMIEALDLLFEEKDSSRKRHVLAARPVGLDVASAVEAEVTSGPYRFTYRKQWFRRPSTVLTVHAPRRENLTGSAAHDRAKEILAETTDLDLWRALRLMQATPLSPTDLSGSTALSDALDEAAGQVESAGSEGDTLLEAAEEAYREFFTATGRATGEYRDSELRLDEARRHRDEAAAAVAEVATDVTRHADLVRELARLESQLAAGEAQAEELQAQWESVQEIVREAEHLAVNSAAARHALETARERASSRAAQIGEVASLRAVVAEQESALAHASEQLGPAEAALDRAIEGESDARAEQRAARRAASRAESDVALVGDLRDLADLADRLRRLDVAVQRRRQARDDERACRFEGSIDDLEQAAHALDLARAEWRAGSPSWRLVPESPALDVCIDGESSVLEGEVTGVIGEPLEIVLPGVARLRLEPSSGAARRADVVARAEERLSDLLAAAGAPDLAAARLAAEASDEARRRLTAAEAAVDAVLAGASTDALRDRADELRRHVVELLTRRRDEIRDESDDAAHDTEGSTGGPRRGGSAPGQAVDRLLGADSECLEGLDAGVVGEIVTWLDETSGVSPNTSPDTSSDTAARSVTSPPASGPGAAEARGALRLAASRARERELRAEDEIARWEAEVTAARAVVESRRLTVARAEASSASARASLDESLSRLAIARERHGDDSLDAAVGDAEAASSQAAAREEAVVAEVARHDPDSLRVRLEGAVSACTSLRGRFGEVRDERLAVEARLRHAGEQGRAERLSEAESALARAERAHAALRRRAAAARLLYETLTRHRDHVRSTYVEPFGRAVSRLGRVVYGPDFDVEIGPSLTIDARILGDERIPYESLSSGAKEQMSILTRLACASLVDPRQGAPVILDDALGYSDPTRLQRVCSAFSLVGGSAQVILLTCTPGRYAAIPDAHVIRI